VGTRCTRILGPGKVWAKFRSIVKQVKIKAVKKFIPS
jgi:hypothetical protein